jgi:N utilization substance protein A
VSDEIAAIEGMTSALLVAVGEKGVKTLDDLADLAADELIEMAGAGTKLEEDQANAIIMAARQHWFDNEPAAAEKPAAGE